MSMNTHFEKAVKDVLQIERKAGGFWQELCLFVRDQKDHTEDAMKQSFKQQEHEAASLTKKRKLSEFGAYRSAKSVIMSALKHDIAIFDGDRVRGKTEVEKDIKAAKTSDKSEIDKLKSALNTAKLISVKLERKEDFQQAVVLTKALLDDLIKAMQSATA